MRKYLIGFVCLIMLAAASCKKDKDMKKATVVDTGDVARGGCGYLIRLEDGSEKKPKYLPSMYQHDGYKVKVKFDADGEGTICRTHPVNDFVEVIDITDIKRDLD